MKFEVLIRNNNDDLISYRYIVNSIIELDTILNSFRDLNVSQYHIEIKTLKGDK